MTDAHVSEPVWLTLARAELAANTREVKGPGVSPRILSYYETLGVKPEAVDDDGQPWCAVFASAMLKRAGYAPPHRFRAARAFLEWGELCEMKPGAVVVLNRVDPKAPTVPHGHVGFYLYTSGGMVWLLSGNSGNRVSVHHYEPERIVGVRWPA